MPILQHTTFVEEVEKIVKRTGIDYIDAVLKWVGDHGFEPEYAADLIKKNPSLKAKIQMEAEDLHFLKRESRLDI